MGGGGGLDYMKSAPGILDHWEVVLAIFFVVCLDLDPNSGVEYPSAYVAWDVIIGLLGLISLVIVLLKIFGVNLPDLVLKIYYIVGAVLTILMGLVIIIICNVKKEEKANGILVSSHFVLPGWYSTNIGISLTMGVFYIYSVMLVGGK